MSKSSVLALLILGVSIFPASRLSAAPDTPLGKPDAGDQDFVREIQELEKKHGGKIGVAAKNLADRRQLTHRGDQRFAMCSTFKLLLVATVASRVDHGREFWERKISYASADLLSYAPVTGKAENLEAGAMSVSDLCSASLQFSDNTAANLLLKSIGGPGEMTQYLRSIGDSTSRLDRIEPDLNANIEGDPRDTTTPDAMVATMEKLLTGKVLSPASRERLVAWMVGNKTGDKRLRAGMNPGWKIGDKTGTGENGAANDVAIVWAAEQAPFLIAVFQTGSTATPQERDQVIAECGRIVSSAFVPK